MVLRPVSWIVIAALAVLAAVHGWLAYAIPKVLADHYLQREVLVSQQFLTGILAAEPGPGTLFAEPVPSPALASFAAHVRKMPGVVRANVYSPDGFIRHSTDPNLIGVQFAINRDLAESFGGRPMASILDAAEAHKDEHLALNVTDGSALLEAYIPVPDAAGRIAAVAEFYRKDPELAGVRAEARRLVWLAAAVNVLVMLGVAALLVRSARRR